MTMFTTVVSSLAVVALAIFVSQMAQQLDEELNACGTGVFKDGKCECVRPYTGKHCQLVDCGYGEIIDSQFLVDSITTPEYENGNKIVPGCKCETKFWGYDCAQCTTKNPNECTGFCKDNYYGARCDILCKQSDPEDVQGLSHAEAGGVFNYYVENPGGEPFGLCQYDGSVKCREGRAGKHCELQCPACEYGSCNLDDGTCDCFDGYYGDLCDGTCPGRCSGKNGVCQETGKCKCEPGFTGDDCSLECCVRDFGTDIGRVHGECNPLGGCKCDSGWSGPECDCNANITCSGRGSCSGGDCVCEPQFQGARCEMCNDTRIGPFCQYDRFQCPDAQTLNGEFVAINTHGDYACECNAGFMGDHCEMCTPSAYPKSGPVMCTYIVPASLCNRGQVKDDFAGSGVMCDCEVNFDNGTDCQNCKTKYFGPDCDVFCDVQCSNSGGTCMNYPEPGCLCPPGKTNVGGVCVVCGGDTECVHGDCFRGRCQCDPGYYGDDCNTSAPVFKDKVCNGYTPVLKFETATCDTAEDCTSVTSESLSNRQVAYRAQQYGRDMFCYRLDTPLQLKGETGCCVDSNFDGKCDKDMLGDQECATGEIVADICNERVLEGEVNVFEWCLSQERNCTKNGECVDPDLCQDRCDLGLNASDWVGRWERDHIEDMASLMSESWKFPISFPDPYEYRNSYILNGDINDICVSGTDYDTCRDYLIPNAQVFNMTHMYVDEWKPLPTFETCKFGRYLSATDVNGTKTVALEEPIYAGRIEVISDPRMSAAFARYQNGDESYPNADGDANTMIDSITFFGKGKVEVVVYNYTTEECADFIRKSAYHFNNCKRIKFHELDYSWSAFCEWRLTASVQGGFDQRCYDQSKVCAGCEDYQEGCEGLPLKSDYDSPMPYPCNTYWDGFCDVYMNETVKPTGYCAYAECECDGYAVGGDACNLQCPVPQFTGTEAPCGEDMDPPWGECNSHIGAIAFGLEQGECDCYNGGSPSVGCAQVCEGEQDCSPDVDTPFSFVAFNCSDIADVQSIEVLSETEQRCHVNLRDSVCNYWRGRCECATPFTAFTKLEEPMYFHQGSYRIALMQGYEIDEYAPFVKYVAPEESLLRLMKQNRLCVDEYIYPTEQGLVCADEGVKKKNTDWTVDNDGKRCKDYTAEDCFTYFTKDSGYCDEYITTEQECEEAANILGITYHDARALTNYPTGCISITTGDATYFNLDTASASECGASGYQCICKSSKKRYDDKIPSSVACEKNTDFDLEDMTKEECLAFGTFESSTSLSDSDASDVYDDGYDFKTGFRVFDFGKEERLWNLEISGSDGQFLVEQLDASSMTEAFTSNGWSFVDFVGHGNNYVNIKSRFVRIRGIVETTYFRKDSGTCDEYITTAEECETAAVQLELPKTNVGSVSYLSYPTGCIKNSNDFMYVNAVSGTAECGAHGFTCICKHTVKVKPHLTTRDYLVSKHPVKVKPHLTTTDYLVSDTKQGCIKHQNDITYYDFKPDVYTSEKVECSYTFKTFGSCDVAYSKGMMGVRDCAEACREDERVMFTMVSGECMCAADNCDDFTVTSDKMYHINDNDACGYKFRYHGSCALEKDFTSIVDHKECRDKCHQEGYTSFSMPCKCQSQCTKGLLTSPAIYHIQSGYTPHDFIELKSKSCEHFGHKTINNKELCRNGSLVLGYDYSELGPIKGKLQSPEILGNVNSVAECKENCGRKFKSYSEVTTEGVFTDIDTQCSKDSNKIKDVIPEICLGMRVSINGASEIGCDGAKKPLLKVSGTCDEPITDKYECYDTAIANGFTYSSGRGFATSTPSWPPGCVNHNGNVIFNMYPSTEDCGTLSCICKGAGSSSQENCEANEYYKTCCKWEDNTCKEKYIPDMCRRPLPSMTGTEVGCDGATMPDYCKATHGFFKEGHADYDSQWDSHGAYYKTCCKWEDNMCKEKYVDDVKQACVEEDCSHATPTAIYSDCQPTEEEEFAYTLQAGGHCEYPVLTEEECQKAKNELDISYAVSAQSSNTKPAGCLYKDGEVLFNRDDPVLACGDYKCICRVPHSWRKVEKSQTCACSDEGGITDYTVAYTEFTDVGKSVDISIYDTYSPNRAKGCSGGVYNMDPSNVECENCICLKGEGSYRSDFVEVKSKTCEDHGFYHIKTLETCLEALSDVRFDTKNLAQLYFTQTPQYTDVSQGCAKHPERPFSLDGTQPCTEDKPCMCVRKNVVKYELLQADYRCSNYIAPAGPGDQGYADPLEASDPLASTDRAQECANRCFAEGYTHFYLHLGSWVDGPGRCMCASDDCSARTHWANTADSYKIIINTPVETSDRYVMKTSGTCSDHFEITSREECIAAAAIFGVLKNENPGDDFTNHQSGAKCGVWNKYVHFGDATTQCSETYPCICRLEPPPTVFVAGNCEDFDLQNFNSQECEAYAVGGGGEQYISISSGTCNNNGLSSITTTSECGIAAQFLGYTDSVNTGTWNVQPGCTVNTANNNVFLDVGTSDAPCSLGNICICKKEPYQEHTEGTMPQNKCLYVNGVYHFNKGTSSSKCSDRVPCVCKGKSPVSIGNCPEDTTSRTYGFSEICYPTAKSTPKGEREILKEYVTDKYKIEEIGSGMCAPDHDMFFHNRDNPYRVSDNKEIPDVDACKDECFNTEGCTGFSFSTNPTVNYRSYEGEENGKWGSTGASGWWGEIYADDVYGNGVQQIRHVDGVECLQFCEEYANRRPGQITGTPVWAGAAAYFIDPGLGYGGCRCIGPGTSWVAGDTNYNQRSFKIGVTKSETTCVLSTNGCDEPVLLGDGKCTRGRDYTDKTMEECEQLCIDDDYCRTFSWRPQIWRPQISSITDWSYVKITSGTCDEYITTAEECQAAFVALGLATTTSGKCNEYITNIAECEAAAAAMGFSDTTVDTADTVNTQYLVRGCFIVGDSLLFNSYSSTINCGTSGHCICKENIAVPHSQSYANVAPGCFIDTNLYFNTHTGSAYECSENSQCICKVPAPLPNCRVSGRECHYNWHRVHEGNVIPDEDDPPVQTMEHDYVVLLVNKYEGESVHGGGGYSNMEACHGDCDSGQCMPGTVCYERSPDYPPPPGCYGLENFNADTHTDYCVYEEYMDGTMLNPHIVDGSRTTGGGTIVLSVPQWGGTCEANGWHTIMDEHECMQAAQLLVEDGALPDTTTNLLFEVESPKIMVGPPKGCFYDGAHLGGSIRLNTNEGGVSDSTWKSICRRGWKRYSLGKTDYAGTRYSFTKKNKDLKPHHMGISLRVGEEYGLTRPTSKHYTVDHGPRIFERSLDAPGHDDVSHTLFCGEACLKMSHISYDPWEAGRASTWRQQNDDEAPIVSFMVKINDASDDGRCYCEESVSDGTKSKRNIGTYHSSSGAYYQWGLKAVKKEFLRRKEFAGGDAPWECPLHIVSATTSSQYSVNYPPENVMDGDFDTIMHTNNDANAWVQLNLAPGVRSIGSVKIWPRTGSPYRLSDFILQWQKVGESVWTNCGTYFYDQPEGKSFPCAVTSDVDIAAVRVYKTKQDYFDPREIQVRANCGSPIVPHTSHNAYETMGSLDDVTGRARKCGEVCKSANMKSFTVNVETGHCTCYNLHWDAFGNDPFYNSYTRTYFRNDMFGFGSEIQKGKDLDQHHYEIIQPRKYRNMHYGKGRYCGSVGTILQVTGNYYQMQEQCYQLCENSKSFLLGDNGDCVCQDTSAECDTFNGVTITERPWIVNRGGGQCTGSSQEVKVYDGYDASREEQINRCAFTCANYGEGDYGDFSGFLVPLESSSHNTNYKGRCYCEQDRTTNPRCNYAADTNWERWDFDMMYGFKGKGEGTTANTYKHVKFSACLSICMDSNCDSFSYSGEECVIPNSKPSFTYLATAEYCSNHAAPAYQPTGSAGGYVYRLQASDPLYDPDGAQECANRCFADGRTSFYLLTHWPGRCMCGTDDCSTRTTGWSSPNSYSIIPASPVAASRVASSRIYDVSNRNTYQQFKVLNEDTASITPPHMGVPLIQQNMLQIAKGYKSCDNPYQLITEKTCGELDGEAVASKTACEVALAQLGHSVTVDEVAFVSEPPGCYYDTTDGKGKFNTITEFVPASASKQSVCEVPLLRLTKEQCQEYAEKQGLPFEAVEDTPEFDFVCHPPPPKYEIRTSGPCNKVVTAEECEEAAALLGRDFSTDLINTWTVHPYACFTTANAADNNLYLNTNAQSTSGCTNTGTNGCVCKNDLVVKWTPYETSGICLENDFPLDIEATGSYKYEEFNSGACMDRKCEALNYKWTKRTPSCAYLAHAYRGQIKARHRGRGYAMHISECVNECVNMLTDGWLGQVNTGVHKLIINRWRGHDGTSDAADAERDEYWTSSCECLPLTAARFCDENAKDRVTHVDNIRQPSGCGTNKDQPCAYWGATAMPDVYNNVHSITVTADIKCNYASVFRTFKAFERSVVTFQSAVDECFKACVTGSLFHRGGVASVGDMNINGFRVERGTYSNELTAACDCVEIPETPEECEIQSGTPTYKQLPNKLATKDDPTGGYFGWCSEGVDQQEVVAGAGYSALEVCENTCTARADCDAFSYYEGNNHDDENYQCLFANRGCGLRGDGADHYWVSYAREDPEVFKIVTSSAFEQEKSKYTISSEDEVGTPVFFPKDNFVPQEKEEWYTHLDFTKYSIETDCTGKEPVFDDECAHARSLFPEWQVQACPTGFTQIDDFCQKVEEIPNTKCTFEFTPDETVVETITFTGTVESDDYLVNFDGETTEDPMIQTCQTLRVVKTFTGHPLSIISDSNGTVVASDITDQELTLQPGTYTYQCDLHPDVMKGEIQISDCSPSPLFKDVTGNCAEECSKLFISGDLANYGTNEYLINTHYASDCRCHFTRVSEQCGLEDNREVSDKPLYKIMTTPVNECINDHEMICKEAPEEISDNENYMCMSEDVIKVFDSSEQCVVCGGGEHFDIGSVFFNENGDTDTCTYAEETSVCGEQVPGWSQYQIRYGFSSYEKSDSGYCDDYKDMELDFSNMILSEMIESCATACKAFQEYTAFTISRTFCYCTKTDCDTRIGNTDTFKYTNTDVVEIDTAEIVQKWNTNAPGLRCFKDVDHTDEAPCDWIRALKHFARGGSYRIGDCHNLAPGTDIETQVPCNGHGFPSAGVCACDYAENFELRSSGVGLTFEAPNLRQTPFRGKACEFMCPGYDMYNMDSVCSGHGRCETDGRCSCEQGFTGYNCHLACETETKALTCSGHGVCNERQQPLRRDIVEVLNNLECKNETLYLTRDRVIRVGDVIYYMYKSLDGLSIDSFIVPTEVTIDFKGSTNTSYKISVDGASDDENPLITVCQTFTIIKSFDGEPFNVRKNSGEILAFNWDQQQQQTFNAEPGRYEYISINSPVTHRGFIDVVDCLVKNTKVASISDFYIRGQAVRRPFGSVSEFPFMPCKDRINITKETAFHPLIEHTTPNVSLECSLLPGYVDEAYTLLCGSCQCEESQATGFWSGYDCRTPSEGYFGKDGRDACPGLTADKKPCNGGGTCTWGTVDGLGETPYVDAQCFCGDTTLDATYATAPRNLAGDMMFHVMNFEDALYFDTLDIVDGNNTECFQGTVPIGFHECQHDWVSNGGVETIVSEAAVVSDVRNDVVLDFESSCDLPGSIINQVKTEEILLLGNKREQQMKCAGACFGEYKFSFDGRCPEGGVLVLNEDTNPGATWDEKSMLCAQACRAKSIPIVGEWSNTANPGFSIKQNGECVCDTETSCSQIISKEWKHFDFVTPYTFVRTGSNVGIEYEVGPPEGDTDNEKLVWCASMCQHFVFDDQTISKGFLYTSSNPTSCICQGGGSDGTILNDGRDRYDYTHFSGFTLEYDTSCKCEVEEFCSPGLRDADRFRILGDIAPMPYTLEQRVSIFDGDFICIKDDTIQCKAGPLELTNYNQNDCSCKFGFTGNTCETPRMMCIFAGQETDGTSCTCTLPDGSINPEVRSAGCCTNGLYWDQIRYSSFSPLVDFDTIPDNIFYYDALKSVCKPGPMKLKSESEGADAVKIHNYAALTDELYITNPAVCNFPTELPMYKAVFKYNSAISTDATLTITKEEIRALGYEYDELFDKFVDEYAKDRCLYRCTHRTVDEDPFRSFHLRKTRTNLAEDTFIRGDDEDEIRTFDGGTPGHLNPGNLDSNIIEPDEIEYCRQSCISDLQSTASAYQNLEFRTKGYVPTHFAVNKNGRCYCFANLGGQVSTSSAYASYERYNMVPDIEYDCTCSTKPAFVGGNNGNSYVEPIFKDDQKVYDIVYPKDKTSAKQNIDCFQANGNLQHIDIQVKTVFDEMTGLPSSITPTQLNIKGQRVKKEVDNFYDCYKECNAETNEIVANSFLWGRRPQIPIVFAGNPVSPYTKLKHCWSHCNSDSDCETGLKCVQRHKDDDWVYAWPGCIEPENADQQWGSGDTLENTDNICYDPTQLEDECYCTVHDTDEPPCISTFQLMGAGYCSNKKNLGAGAYPPVLEEGHALYDADKRKECMIRCLSEYPDTKAFFTKTVNGEDRCACAEDYCAERVGGAPYLSYRIEQCDTNIRPGFLMEEHTDYYKLSTPKMIVADDVEYQDTMPVNPYTCGLESIVHQGDIVSSSCNCPINNFEEVFVEYEYKELSQDGSCYSYHSESGTLDHCKTQCDARYGCNSFSHDGTTCSFAVDCDKEWDVRVFASFFCYGQDSGQYTNVDDASTAEKCAENAGTSQFGWDSEDQTCYKFNREYINMDDCTALDGTSWAEWHAPEPTENGGSYTATAYTRSITSILQGGMRNDWYYGELDLKSYYILQSPNYDISSAKRYVKQIVADSKDQYCTVGEEEIYSVAVSDLIANDHTCMQKCREEFPNLEFVIARGEVKGETFSCLCSDFDPDDSSSGCNNPTKGGTQYKVSNTPLKSCKCPGFYIFDGQAISCPSGRYSGGDDPCMSSCKLCPRGRFSEIGYTECESCPAGKIQEGVSCTDCLPGQSSPAGVDQCFTCALGLYTDVKGTPSCLDCPNGYYDNDASIGTSCKICPKGYYAGLATKITCSECPTGKYGDSTAMLECKECAAGKFQPNTASISSTSCTNCPAGKYQNLKSQASCKNCPAGQYQSQAGRTGCVACSAGQYQNSNGQTVCKNCPKGQYRPQTGYSSCIVCPTGKYADQTARTSCKTCGAGTYQNQNGQTSSGACHHCPAGKYQGSAGQASCNSCGDLKSGYSWGSGPDRTTKEKSCDSYNKKPTSYYDMFWASGCKYDRAYDCGRNRFTGSGNGDQWRRTCWTGDSNNCNSMARTYHDYCDCWSRYDPGYYSLGCKSSWGITWTFEASVFCIPGTGQYSD